VTHTAAALRATAAGQEVLHRGGSQLNGALAAGEVQHVAAGIPVPAARTALLDAYHVGFSASLNHLMVIGAIVAFVGMVCAFALVRQRDFVIPGGGPGGSGGHGGPDRPGGTAVSGDGGAPAAPVGAPGAENPVETVAAAGGAPAPRAAGAGGGAGGA
jgi:hypothetical protein